MFAQQLVNGLTVGSVYALIAIGFSMVYGILRIVNFAHGDIFMMGTFFGLTLSRTFGIYFVVALPLAGLCTALLGIAIERFAYRPIRVADRLASLISAMGVSIMLANIAQVIFGTETRPFSVGIEIQRITIGSVVLSNLQIYILLLSTLLMIALYTMVQKTKFGVAMRATSHSLDNAKLMGINTNHVIAMTFAIGSILAAIAGFMAGAYYDAVYPTMGYNYGLKAFAAAVLGGIGNLPGAMLGGILIGVIESLGAAYISSGYTNAFAFGILIIVLIFKPSGILGRATRDKV
ncbi:MAG: branched-chain amino acid ABC transporter permease [Christensenellales bacterium]|jgi:branched-chain amino acid transport system permease protein